MAELNKYILFQMNEQTFAIDVDQVISIERMQMVTAVPRAREFIKGVTEIRSETTAILDLREFLGIRVKEYTDNTRILVVSIDSMQVGLIVDGASEVRDIEAENVQPAPKIVTGIRDDFLKGVAKMDDELILLLNLERILDFEDKNELKDVLHDA